MLVAPQDTKSDYVACSACGATHAKRHVGYRQRSSFGLCKNSVADFYVQNGNKRFTAAELNGLLASRLRNVLARKSSGKVTGRCEAITGDLGFQCAQHAQSIARGRRVCTQHANSKSLRFACDGPQPKHGPLFDLIRFLADRDKSFAAALADFAQEYRKP